MKFKPKKIDPKERIVTISEMCKAISDAAVDPNDLIKLLRDENFAFDMMERDMIANHIQHLEELLQINNIEIEEE